MSDNYSKIADMERKEEMLNDRKSNLRTISEEVVNGLKEKFGKITDENNRITAYFSGLISPTSRRANLLLESEIGEEIIKKAFEVQRRGKFSDGIVKVNGKPAFKIRKVGNYSSELQMGNE